MLTGINYHKSDYHLKARNGIDFYLIICVFPVVTEKVIITPSTKKVEQITVSKTPELSVPITGYRIINTEILLKIFQTLVCPECLKEPLKLIENFP